jgi:hypothetical protein
VKQRFLGTNIMRQWVSLILLSTFFAGCASVKEGTSSPPKHELRETAEQVSQAQPAMPQLQNVDQYQLESYELQTGVIFAKTDFKGVLEKTYVQLFFEDVNNDANKFILYIGDKAGQQAFPWDVKPVQPGYFFVELPAGEYKVTSITIPVGSTQAIEPIDISLEVTLDQVVYVGTLQVVGTKERIKLGGLPVIKPGFEYAATVLNEQEEAMDIFHQRYPDYSKEIKVEIMQLNVENLSDNEGEKK